MKRGVWFAVAETFGVIALLGILLLYLAAMGGYWISGVGIFLMPITIAGYLLLTWLSHKCSFRNSRCCSEDPNSSGVIGETRQRFVGAEAAHSKSRYWIMYAAKILFMIGMFLLSPVISDVMARPVNG